MCPGSAVGSNISGQPQSITRMPCSRPQVAGASETLAGAERPVHPNVFNAEVGTVARGGHRGLGPRSDEYGVKHAPPAVNQRVHHGIFKTARANVLVMRRL